MPAKHGQQPCSCVKERAQPHHQPCQEEIPVAQRGWLLRSLSLLASFPMLSRIGSCPSALVPEPTGQVSQTVGPRRCWPPGGCNGDGNRSRPKTVRPEQRRPPPPNHLGEQVEDRHSRRAGQGRRQPKRGHAITNQLKRPTQWPVKEGRHGHIAHGKGIAQHTVEYLAGQQPVPRPHHRPEYRAPGPGQQPAAPGPTASARQLWRPPARSRDAPGAQRLPPVPQDAWRPRVRWPEDRQSHRCHPHSPEQHHIARVGSGAGNRSRESKVARREEKAPTIRNTTGTARARSHTFSRKGWWEEERRFPGGATEAPG